MSRSGVSGDGLSSLLRVWTPQRLVESFEGLNSSLAQSAEELCSCYVNWIILPDIQVQYICRLAANVLSKA